MDAQCEQRPMTVELVCPTCGEAFKKLGRAYRWNLKQGYTTYCSRSCAARAPRGLRKHLHGTLTGYYRCGPPPCEACQRAMDDWKRSLEHAAPSSNWQDTGPSTRQWGFESPRSH